MRFPPKLQICLPTDGSTAESASSTSKDGSTVRDHWNQFQGWENSPQQQQGGFTATWHFNYTTVFKTRARGEIWTSATYSGAVTRGLAQKKKIRNARHGPYIKLSYSQCGPTSGPKQTIHWDMKEVSQLASLYANIKDYPTLNSPPHSALAITMLLRQINELNTLSGNII